MYGYKWPVRSLSQIVGYCSNPKNKTLSFEGYTPPKY